MASHAPELHVDAVLSAWLFSCFTVVVTVSPQRLSSVF